MITPVWVEQGSINTNYPLYCKPQDDQEQICVPNIGVFVPFGTTDQSESYNQLINNTIEINSVEGIEMFITLSLEEQYLLVGKLEFTLNYSTFNQVISNQSEQTLENLTNNYTFETISGGTVDLESSDSEYNLSISGLEYNISISSEIENLDICGSNIDLNNTIISPSFSQDYNLLANGVIKIFSSNGKTVFNTLDNWEKLSLISIIGDISNSELGQQDANDPCVAYSALPKEGLRVSLGDFYGSPFNNTVFPLCWGSGNVLPSPFSTSGSYTMENSYDIIKTCGILLDGKVRENILEAGIYEYIEKYQKSNGNGTTYNGLLCYNFCLHTNPYDLQPSGAMNLSKFTTIELEITTMTPPIDDKAQYANICKEEVLPDGTIQSIQIGVNKPSWSIFEYTYDIHFMEERYNIVKFVGGNVGLEFTR